MLLTFIFILVALSSASKSTLEVNTYLLVRDQTPGPSSKANPFILISFDVVQDVELAHLRPASEILEQNLEILVLDSSISYYGDGPYPVKEVSEVKIPAERFDTVRL